MLGLLCAAFGRPLLLRLAGVAFTRRRLCAVLGSLPRLRAFRWTLLVAGLLLLIGAAGLARTRLGLRRVAPTRALGRLLLLGRVGSAGAARLALLLLPILLFLVRLIARALLFAVAGSGLTFAGLIALLRRALAFAAGLFVRSIALLRLALPLTLTAGLLGAVLLLTLL